jgi:oligogalacturonide lyase
MKATPETHIKSILSIFLLISTVATGQIGTRFPSEKKVIKDPLTGTELTFLTSKSAGDSKIYQTHNQWTSDGSWVIFRSNRVRGEAMAVNEKTGIIVQVSEGGFTGMLNVARKSMKLYFMRNMPREQGSDFRMGGPVQVIEVDLAKLFADSEAGKLKPASEYQRICGTTPAEMGAGGDMALDGDEEVVYFRVGKEEAAKHLPEGTKIEPDFGPRRMGAGPAGIGSMNLKTGETKFVVAVPFQVGDRKSVV